MGTSFTKPVSLIPRRLKCFKRSLYAIFRGFDLLDLAQLCKSGGKLSFSYL